MILETGRVTTSANGKALIEIEKQSACAECHAGCACDLETNMMTIEAYDPIGVQPDQRVQVTIPAHSALKAAAAVYGVATLALIIGVVVGEYIGKLAGVDNVFEILGVFSCLGLSLIFIRYYNTIFRQNRKNHPVITQVLG